VAPGGWLPVSQAAGVFGRLRLDNFPFPALTTTHQERSDLTLANGSYDPSLAVLSVWDFPADLARFGELPSATSLTGVRWGSVRSFNPAGNESTPATNTPNSYAPSRVAMEPHVIWKFVNPRYVPVFGVWELGGAPHDPGDPPWETFVDGASAPIEQAIAGGAQFAGERFDPAGLALLAAVAAGTSDLLVGDDVVGGVPYRSNMIAAVVVDHGTTHLRGGFVPTASGPIATVSGRQDGTAVDPPDLRCFDAADGLLRTLHVDATGASLASLDVREALAGTGAPSVSVVSGDAPRAPLAIAWDGFDASLYVVDGVPSEGGTSTLRLLRIDRKATSTELWHLAPAATLPTHLWISIGPQGERVLALTRHGRSEVAAFDALGAPRWSLAVHGELAAQPVSLEGGVSLALRADDSSQGLLKLRRIPRKDAANHLCGARWLRHHVSTAPLSVLGDPSLDCDDDEEDGDDCSE
jgi:hypothetical protein